MKNNTIKSLIYRLEKITDKYKQPLPLKALNNIKNLTPFVKLPNDFVILNSICRCDFFSIFELYNFENEEGVVKNTKALRELYNLPNNYIVLAEDDPGLILMKINSEENAEVIMCSHYDFENICQGKPMEEDPTIFPTFTDFYEYLLDEEEKNSLENQGKE